MSAVHMSQADADAVLASVIASIGNVADTSLTVHFTEGVHLNRSDAQTRAVAFPATPCGYFQQQEITANKKADPNDPESWNQVGRHPVKGSFVDISNVYVFLKKFFKGAVTARGSLNAANLEGDIPGDYRGYTNLHGPTNYVQVKRMRVVVSGLPSWEFVTVYPII